MRKVATHRVGHRLGTPSVTMKGEVLHCDSGPWVVEAGFTARPRNHSLLGAARKVQLVSEFVKLDSDTSQRRNRQMGEIIDKAAGPVRTVKDAIKTYVGNLS